MNPMTLLGLRSDFEKFKKNHPKFIQFTKAFTKAGHVEIVEILKEVNV